MNKDKISDYLRLGAPGKRKAMKSEALELALNVSGNELRKCVNRLRREGIPIGSSRDGYFYAVTAGEVYSTIRQLKCMEDGLHAALCGLEQALDSFNQEKSGH